MKPTIICAQGAALLVLALPLQAADGDGALNASLAALSHGLSERGAWVNRYMPLGTGRDSARSADEILIATLRVYTRDVLDRGGWVNPYVPVPGYDAGNPLLAARLGEGVTSTALGASPQASALLASTSSGDFAIN